MKEWILEVKQIPFFIGVGGSGMSSLAKILLEKGLAVFGQDKSESDTVLQLKAQGLHFIPDLKHLEKESIDFAVYSSAISKENNPFYKYCLSKNIPLFHRSEIMHKIFSECKSIAVAGSHGKTSTSAMVAEILYKNKKNPTIMIGGEVSYLKGSGGKFGNGEWGVYESDESDGTFLNHKAEVQIITNIDNDHLDFYKTTEKLSEAFQKFISLRDDSFAFTNVDDPGVSNMLQGVNNKKNIFGISSQNNKILENIIHYEIQKNTMHFSKNGKDYSFSTPFAGDHYLTNGLLAILATEIAGVKLEDSIAILQKYSGVKRRLEYLGEFNRIKVYDDYGHHPTEIQSVLSSMQKMKQGKESVAVVFQPHRYTRTKELYREFAHVLSNVDKLFLLPIYPAGEDPLPGISSDLIYRNLTNKQNTWYLTGSMQKDILVLKKEVEPGDLLVTIGAGSVRSWGERFLADPVFFHLPVNGSSGNP